MNLPIFKIFLRHIDIVAKEPDINLAATVIRNRIADHLRNENAETVECKEYLIPLMNELGISVLDTIPDRKEMPIFRII